MVTRVISLASNRDSMILGFFAHRGGVASSLKGRGTEERRNLLTHGQLLPRTACHPGVAHPAYMPTLHGLVCVFHVCVRNTHDDMPVGCGGLASSDVCIYNAQHPSGTDPPTVDASKYPNYVTRRTPPWPHRGSYVQSYAEMVLRVPETPPTS